MKLIASVLLVFNTPAVLIPILLVGGVQGLITSIRKEEFIPYVLSICLGTVIFVALPQFHG